MVWWCGGARQAVPIICFAFLCHQNIFPVFQQLDGNDHKRMSRVSWFSIGLCWAVYFSVGLFGSVPPCRPNPNHLTRADT